MNKLIKLSDTHYIVVDDSEMINCKCYDFSKKEIVDSIFYNKQETYCKKITHSTQPLSDVKFTNFFDKIKPLSLSEAEEAVYGYSVNKLFLKWESENGNCYNNEDSAFEAGFKAHQELVKDKLFTVDDVSKIFAVGVQLGINQELFTQQGKPLQDENVVLQRTLQSLLPPTEWDVEFDEQGKIKIL